MQIPKHKKAESDCALIDYRRLTVQGEDVGCALNRRRHHLTGQWEYFIVFDFKLPSICSLLYPDETEAILKRLERSLKRLHCK